MVTFEEQAIISYFPELVNDSGYIITSPCTRRYNCIAWAIGRNDIWYWPPLGQEPEDDEYWPADIPDDDSIDAFVIAMKKEGYSICEDSCKESDYIKIALYSKDERCTHAARQLLNGMWTSKLGPLHDIQHSTPYSLEGNFYGKVKYILKKKSTER